LQIPSLYQEVANAFNPVGIDNHFMLLGAGESLVGQSASLWDGMRDAGNWLLEAVDSTGIGAAGVDLAKLAFPHLADRIEAGKEIYGFARKAIKGLSADGSSELPDIVFRDLADYAIAAKVHRLWKRDNLFDFGIDVLLNILYPGLDSASLVPPATAPPDDTPQSLHSEETLRTACEIVASCWNYATEAQRQLMCSVVATRSSQEFVVVPTTPKSAQAASAAPPIPMSTEVSAFGVAEYPVVSGVKSAGDRAVAVGPFPGKGRHYRVYALEGSPSRVEKVSIDLAFEGDFRLFARTLAAACSIAAPTIRELYVTTCTTAVDGDSWQLAALFALLGVKNPTLGILGSTSGATFHYDVEGTAPEALSKLTTATGAVGMPGVNAPSVFPVLPVGSVPVKMEIAENLVVPSANVAGGLTSVRIQRYPGENPVRVTLNWGAGPTRFAERLTLPSLVTSPEVLHFENENSFNRVD
jgi:hypothetical protein